MGNYNTSAVNFLQSPFDFPLTVSLGEKMPSWGLSRWGNSGLRFVPPDDEGFTLRGDRRRLLYRGRRRSHRFTILGDCSFEYACILEKSPDTNIISLFMDGAENFDFFRQPDFVPDDFLKGSYAVYKKETLIGEGTGKLCHIHRPEIIDARGRRCWGDLAVVGNELRVTIPEQWLYEAAYPVIVDPTIGTSTVGSQTHWNNVENESYDQLFLEVSIAVNRFLLSETFNGTATAYVYAYDTDYYGRCKPVIYSDNSNVPLTRRSANEGEFDIAVKSGKPAGWRSTTFNTNTSIASGNYIWFGLFCDWFAPRFDFGAKCYWDFWDLSGNTNIPNTYPVWSTSWYYNFKLSMYFTYTSAQNYVRTLTQGVKLTDSRKLKADYKRTATQTAKVNSTISRFETFIRKCVMTVKNTMAINRFPLLLRKVTEQINVTMSKNEKMSFTRKCIDGIKINSEIKRIHNVIRSIQDGLKSLDAQSFSALFVRSVNDTAIVTDYFRHLGSFVRGLFVTAGNVTKTTHTAVYKRKQTDIVQAEGAVFRGLLLFVRIVTQVFVRDYLLRRFLIAKEELILKSVVCREIVLESKID
jgi:hypothetical protein